ncbi:MAG TPA: hypothetical protein VGM89_19120 [Puia sp.]
MLKTLSLYNANIRLSQAFLPVLSYFEVALRNRIDQHYQQAMGYSDWLLTAALTGGFLTKSGCISSSEKILLAHAKLGVKYTHDKLVAELSFGFWRFMFAGNQYQAGGNTLLAIFPHLPARSNQNFVYQKLKKINSIRNRIAHHEPICFGTFNSISASYARNHFQEIADILGYLGIDRVHLFRGFKGIPEEANYIDSI